jgi:hypothetical protein
MMIAQNSPSAAEPATSATKLIDSASPHQRGSNARIARMREDITLAAWKTFLAERGFQPAAV